MNANAARLAFNEKRETRLAPLPIAALAMSCLIAASSAGISAYACDTPELRSTPDNGATLILTPKECGALTAPESAASSNLPWVKPYTFWHQCINAHEHITDFLVTPGDYTSWGRLDVYERNGTPERKRVIRYWGPMQDVHPTRRVETNPAYEAIISGFSFGNAHHWILHGLSLHRPEPAQFAGFIGYSGAGVGSSHVIVDSILLENSSNYGIRISAASDSCIQNSVLRNPVLGISDKPGIQLKPLPIVGPTQGNHIVNNEIVNFTDGIALTNYTPTQPGTLDGTVIAGNDLYVTPDYLASQQDGRAGCTENGIDIKVGSSEPSRPVLVDNNRIWGQRVMKYCNGTADAVVVHFFARNVQLRRNTIFDVPLGITSKIFPDSSPTTRNLVIEDNVLYGIRAFRSDSPFPTHDAAAMSLQTPEIVRNNTFSHIDKLFSGDVKDTVVAASIFSGNKLTAIRDLSHVPSGFFMNNQVWDSPPSAWACQ